MVKLVMGIRESLSCARQLPEVRNVEFKFSSQVSRYWSLPKSGWLLLGAPAPAHTLLQQELPAQAQSVQGCRATGMGTASEGSLWSSRCLVSPGTGSPLVLLPILFMLENGMGQPLPLQPGNPLAGSLCTSSVPLVWICGAQPPFCLMDG